MNQWLFFGYGFAAVLGAVLFASCQRLFWQRGGLLLGRSGPPDMVFLFDGPDLLDCSAGARALLRGLKGGGVNDWERLISYLGQWFSDLRSDLENLRNLGQIQKLPQRDGGPFQTISADWYGGLIRLTLALSQQISKPQENSDWHHAAVLAAPFPVWLMADQPDPIAANDAFAQIRDIITGIDSTADTRLRVDHKDGPEWYAVQSAKIAQGTVSYALPITETVRAETSLREFMQTLGKTFAQLPIGLAVFDRDRTLQMFNPALGDLTGLPPDFLARQPALTAVLDAMRDRSMIPEPKDWRNWRKELAELERAAASDGYQEVWNLPGGQTYRVSGRPHPNGGLALIIEDISTETIRTRRYRADLELGQSVLDAVPEGIAVFAPSGQLVMINSAYTTIWGHDPASTIGSGNIGQMAQHWRGLTAPTPLWAEIEDFTAQLHTRKGWQAEARLTDGRLIECKINALAGGATMISFAPASNVPLRAQAAGSRASA